ncbi:MAG: sugar phosphate isomerase/epimerase [Anaerolineales bacterium]|nr:sugar phosphate isomerase/epimerase [Anaerolineales bacterium]MCB9126338.1 sugar phosphate isomerase/epimerase [Ardenticatenales bacterium]
MIALSTMWMQLRHRTLADFCEAAQRLGFDFVELSHVVTLAQISELPAGYGPRVRVLHHPCPNPGGVPALSSLDAERHATAVAHAKQSLDWAARLGAGTVVLHLGEVAVDPRWENAVRARWLQGQRRGDAAPYEALLGTVLSQREAHAAPHRTATRRALDQLLPYAAQRNVVLAMESGEWFRALPSLPEAEALLAQYDDTLGLCIDTGHVTILERLGGPTLDQWLTLNPARLRALHLHDVRGLRDHLVPGNGTLDWPRLASLVPRHALLTCEFDWYYGEDELVAGRRLLADAGLGR